MFYDNIAMLSSLQKQSKMIWIIINCISFKFLHLKIEKCMPLAAYNFYKSFVIGASKNFLEYLIISMILLLIWTILWIMIKTAEDIIIKLYTYHNVNDVDFHCKIIQIEHDQ